jgi:hypothetical protein
MKQFHKICLTVLFLFATSLSMLAQQGNFWKTSDASKVSKEIFAKYEMPAVFQVFELNTDAFVAQMNNAPAEKSVKISNSNFIVSFPLANGVIEQFRVVETPVMEPGLSAKYPGISSYTGKGIENPSHTARFAVSPSGISVTILRAGQSSIYIDKLQGNYYRLVTRDDLNIHGQFQCLTDAVPHPASLTARPGDADQPTLRTYRLALLSGAEFSLHWLDGTEATDAIKKAKVLTAQNIEMTRANAIFERDFSVRLLLVANNDLIIYLVAATDPVANPNSPTGATCQTAINTQIGAANYDIGHTESKGNDNGNAGCIGCVCVNGQKGLGWTVYSNPSNLDFFVVDYMTHEMGHQMGANHTFSFQTEGTGVNVEPGSGITIMGYAGITGTTDIAAHSIDIFHSKSIEQVTNYLYSGSGNPCAVPVATGNAIPTANAGADYIIPKSTPFAITGTGTDADATDVLSYTFEQIDNRTTGGAFPSATATTGPMFRPYLPASTPTQIFPQLQYILTGANGFQWEVLPSVQRDLNFRFTVRDNHPGGGGNKSDNMKVTVNGTSGPFLVTAPNTNVTWTAGTTETVTWSVNGSDAAPVSCATVNIKLSTDGGFTWPITLAANTPNDGTETITVPNNPGTTNRIKVESVGNIFFDIDNANFTIAVPPSGFTFDPSAAGNVTCGVAGQGAVLLGTSTSGGFNTPINLTSTGAPAGTTVSFSVNPLTPGSSVIVLLNNTGVLAPGTYNINVTGTAGTSVQSTVVTYIVDPGTPPAITSQPSNVTVCSGAAANFSVTATGTGFTYQWQVSTDGGTTYTNIAGATSTSYSIPAPTVAENGYLYHVVITAQCGATTSNAATLNVNASPAIATQPASVTVCTGSGNTFSVVGTGGGLNYQWQISTNGGATFTDITGANSATYNLTNITSGQDGNQFQVIVTGACPGTITSAPATLTVGNAPNITTQPSSITTCEGVNADFTSAASGSGLSYQWQVSTDGGATFTNISGATSATYSVPATTALNGNQYHVVITSASCTTPSVSTAGLLTVNALPAVTGQPASSVLCAGSNASFTSTASGTNISYQWQVSTDGGVTFTNIAGATNAAYSITGVTATQNGYQYHVVVSGTCSPAAVSNAATLTVANPETVATQPANTAACVGSNTSFTAAGSSTSTNYQWQVSTNGGGTYTNLTGATFATLNITSVSTSLNGNLYQVLVSNSTCTTPSTSSAALLTINALPTVSAAANNVSVCTGTPVTLTGAGASTYTWQPGNLTGTSVVVNPTVLPSAPSVPNTVTYTVTGTDANSCQNTATVQVTANPLPEVTLTATPANVSLLPGSSVTLNATITPSSGFTYEWRKNDVIIPNTTSSLVVTVEEVGAYTVYARGVNSNVCDRASNILNVRDSITSTVFIWPNPNNGAFTVSYYNYIRNLNQVKSNNITVFDSKGSRIFTKNYAVNQGYNLMKVDLRGVSSGAYYVVLRDGYGNRLASAGVFIKP